MKHIRISPWLIVILAAVMILAAGCNRPDPQVAIDTPQSPNVPQQTGGTPHRCGHACAGCSHACAR